MGKRFSSEEFKSMSENDVICPSVLMELNDDNVNLRSLLFDVIDIVDEEDPHLLKKLDKSALLDWKDRAINYLAIKL